ncbi:VOC family protein [Alkalibacterium sp.]|nr:MAG: VOC family protein [Alkalibacterium sp.]
MNITPYLMLDGNAKEAAHFYADVFDTPIESMELVKDWPQEFEGEIPQEIEDNVMHAHIKIGSTGLMLADAFPEDEYVPGTSITLMIDCKNTTEAKQLYDKLAEEGSVLFAFNETGFSPGYAQVKDKYGIDWQIVTDSPEMD